MTYLGGPDRQNRQILHSLIQIFSQDFPFFANKKIFQDSKDTKTENQTNKRIFTELTE